MRHYHGKFGSLLSVILCALGLGACNPFAGDPRRNEDHGEESETWEPSTHGTEESETETNTSFYTDSDTEFPDSDSCPDTEFPDAGIIEPDCSSCIGIGGTLENMRCAIDLCDDATLLKQTYTSLTAPEKTLGTFAAVTRLGNISNDLSPQVNNSYAVMATGPALGKNHNVELDPEQGTGDFFSKDGYPIFDAMEWRLRLKAPPYAKGFQVSYVFLSAEYDEYVGSPYNDKFYILIEALSTQGGLKTVINFTPCRDPLAYFDFVCVDKTTGCIPEEPYCYVAINTILSECCWYRGCPEGTATTSLSGTGFSCAPNEAADGLIDIGGKGAYYGSSTGWLTTQWPIRGNEEFYLTFHIHDTADAQLDSEVIIDGFRFIAEEVQPGTSPK